ncbi:MAG: imidazole glycerol phosphate synthase cyclase subunit [Candidatus Yanofskybacteria bacterium RIFCSPHIGHO2_01_FULL_42_12]|uniref:imidazole glycerol-phosphate synthase n=1 Tax=Candidatus Yanofskybacteria bacterium RIFCSPLOWO2_01_FULL_42_49 TaxID=1802694 RepID=A0A1F8GBQ6_9BACT|nr:MAG: imidazole glycerol phosphate synthase cyclase subunit [Candidatus Yanofskybacteria bacterium RIFCSPHIGHO2_01_FULL_42_12]OGN22156.1 MAG: imidazole glycerol phosphate synthase cyclase subunit [Candidatus Yanofskybacteria bacterium RIFCSPLOWO2_01_FULL_42_49]
MIKRRLIPVLYIKNGLIVRSEGFSYHHNIGNVVKEAARYNSWDVDELIYIDISREKHYDLRRDDYNVNAYNSIGSIIKEISKVCFMPLTFGGGIRTIDDVSFRIQNGADKITLNTGALENPKLITQAAERYGSQAVVISIDYKIIENQPIVFTDFGQKNTSKSVYNWVKECENLGAGEIFINSIDRDGKANGYDIETINKTVASTKLPTIACGGAGNLEDFVELAKQTNVSAVAAGNIFHFTELSYPRSKILLKKNNLNFR